MPVPPVPVPFPVPVPVPPVDVVPVSDAATLENAKSVFDPHARRKKPIPGFPLVITLSVVWN